MKGNGKGRGEETQGRDIGGEKYERHREETGRNRQRGTDRGEQTEGNRQREEKDGKRQRG